MIKVIDNFLDKKEFKDIQKLMYSTDFPFFYNDSITDDDDPSDHYYFTHMFYNNNQLMSRWFNIWENFLKKIECNALLRIKGSMYVNINEKRKHKPHRDYNFPHKGCLFYMNTNNGGTYFKEQIVLPKENRVVFFNPYELHASSLCTDQNRRLVINFNYF